MTAKNSSLLQIAASQAALPHDSFGGLPSEAVFQSIIRNGGQVILTSKLNDPNGRFGDAGLGKLAGIWDPESGTMKLSSDSNNTYDEYLNTLSHEGIHMAQSCHANSIKASPIPIGLPINKEGMADMEPYRDSNPSYYLSQIEREANSNDELDAQTISRIIDEECGRKPWITLLGKLRSSLQAALLGKP